MQPARFPVDAALPAGLDQQRTQPLHGEGAGVLGGGGGGQDGAGCGAVEGGASGAGEGGQRGRIEVAEQLTQLVVDLDAVPDGVLLGAGQHRDRAGLLAVAGQGPVGVPVGPQDVGQHDRVQRVRLGPETR